MTYRVLEFCRNKMSVIYIYIYTAKKTGNVLFQLVCPSGYYQSGYSLMITHALGQMMQGYTLLVPVIYTVTHCLYNIFVYISYIMCPSE